MYEQDAIAEDRYGTLSALQQLATICSIRAEIADKQKQNQSKRARHGVES
jgi:hypothetical protein